MLQPFMPLDVIAMFLFFVYCHLVFLWYNTIQWAMVEFNVSMCCPLPLRTGVVRQVNPDVMIAVRVFNYMIFLVFNVFWRIRFDDIVKPNG